jgi:hypothetical protein
MRLTTVRFGYGVLALVASALVAAGTPASASPGAQWALQAVVTPAVAPNGQLTATSCAAATSCMAVGVAQDEAGHDASLTQSWDGLRWKHEAVPRPAGALASALLGVSCSAANACTAVGDVQTDAGGQVTLAVQWDGSAWAVESTPNTASATSSVLSAVSCASAASCTAVGYSVDSGNRKSPLAEQWDGRSWEIQSTPGGGSTTNSVLRGVSCTSASACTAVGTSTTDVLPQGLAERWDGTTWQLQLAAAPVGASGSTLAAVSCTTATACTSVGNFTAASTKAAGALAERWDGTTWSVDPTPGSTLDFLNAVSCTSAVRCSAVGQTGFSQPIADRWDGSSWAAQAIPGDPGAAQTTLVGVACPAQNVCVATGSALHDTGDGTNLTVAEGWDGGQWVIQTSFNPLGATAFGFAGVSCPSSRACMAVGYSFDAAGTRLPLAEEWNDSGWQVRPAPTPTGATDAALASVSCLSEQDCTAVGAYSSAGLASALAEHWNGRSWSLEQAASPANATSTFLSSVSCATHGPCTAAGGYVDSSGTVRTLVERGNGTALVIDATPSPTDALYVALNGVDCPSPNSCTAVGLLVDNAFNYLTFAEHWDGTTWAIQATPNPRGTDGPNGTLEGGVSCPSPQSCTAVGQWSPSPAPHPGVGLAEHWNGRSWEIQPTPGPPAVDASDGTHNAPFAGVACPTVSSCTAVGYFASRDANGDFLARAEGWDGTSWSVQPAASPVGAFYSTLQAVACPTPRVCFAVGESTRYNSQTNTRGRPTAIAERSGAGDR